MRRTRHDTGLSSVLLPTCRLSSQDYPLPGSESKRRGEDSAESSAASRSAESEHARVRPRRTWLASSVTAADDLALGLV